METCATPAAAPPPHFHIWRYQAKWNSCVKSSSVRWAVISGFRNKVKLFQSGISLFRYLTKLENVEIYFRGWLSFTLQFIFDSKETTSYGLDTKYIKLKTKPIYVIKVQIWQKSSKILHYNSWQKTKYCHNWWNAKSKKCI